MNNIKLSALKFSAVVIGGIMAVAALPGVGNAAINDETFCQAIGISDGMRPDCVTQMAGAVTPSDKDSIAAAWIAKSPLASNSPSSLYKPATDANVKNGTPGTAYQDKITVSNEVNAQIHRAMKINHFE